MWGVASWVALSVILFFGVGFYESFVAKNAEVELSSSLITGLRYIVLFLALGVASAVFLYEDKKQKPFKHIVAEPEKDEKVHGIIWSESKPTEVSKKPSDFPKPFEVQKPPIKPTIQSPPVSASSQPPLPPAPSIPSPPKPPLASSFTQRGAPISQSVPLTPPPHPPPPPPPPLSPSSPLPSAYKPLDSEQNKKQPPWSRT